MSGQVTARIGPIEVTIDSKDGLLIEREMSEDRGLSTWLSLQEARELIGFLLDNLELETHEHPRSVLRPFLDRSTKRGLDR